MANFKGGFAFNNEAAKVEVEQSPNGALISCINPVTGESMGGGNPNSVEVITGTMANLFGDVDFMTLLNAISSGSAHAIIEGDARALGFGTLVQPVVPEGNPLTYLKSFLASVKTDPTSCLADDLSWSYNSEGNLTFIGAIYNNGTATNISEYGSQIPTTLTIYWHPMP